MNCTSAVSQAYTFDVAILSQIVLNTDVFLAVFQDKNTSRRENKHQKMKNTSLATK